MDDINIEIADILEVDSVADSDELENFVAWDSLAILSLLAYVDTKYNVQLHNNDLAIVKTLADLKKLIESKQ